MLRNPSVRRCNGMRDSASPDSRFTIPVCVPRIPGTLSAVTTTLGRGWPELSGTGGVCATTAGATIVSRTRTDFIVRAARISSSMRGWFERCRQYSEHELIAGYVRISEHEIDVVHSRGWL